MARTYADAQRGHFALSGRLKTGDFLNRWLTDVAARNLRPNSLYNYRRCVRYVLPYIGDIRLSELNLHDFERAFTALDKYYSRATLQLTHRVVKQALEHAVDADLITKNPMRRMKAPRSNTSERKIPSPSECRALGEAAAGTRWEAAVWLLVTTGMRISECLGLRWADVSLETGMVKVEQQTQRVYGESGVRLAPLKSKASRRTLLLPPFMLPILRRHRSIQNEERLAAGPDWVGQGTVFCTPQGRPYFRSQFAAPFRDFAHAAGLPEVTPHTLRHTIVTLLQEKGRPLKAAQELVGHASATTTLGIYSHSSTSAMEETAETVQALFAPFRSGRRNILEDESDGPRRDKRGTLRGTNVEKTSKYGSKTPKPDTTCPYSSVG